jgi:hypothetical protein
MSTSAAVPRLAPVAKNALDSAEASGYAELQGIDAVLRRASQMYTDLASGLLDAVDSCGAGDAAVTARMIAAANEAEYSAKVLTLMAARALDIADMHLAGYTMHDPSVRAV